MQDATTVLSIIQKRGERGLPLKNLYRQLYNPLLYFQAYARLYSNDGAMTPDTTGETVDGMSREKIKIMCECYHESEPLADPKVSHRPGKSAILERNFKKAEERQGVSRGTSR